MSISRDRLDKNDFWMGMAFMFGARSKCGYAALLVDGNTLIDYSIHDISQYKQEAQTTVPPEISLIVNCKKKFDFATLYVTKTIDVSAAYAIIANTGIKKVIYYPSKPLAEDVKKLFLGIYTEIVKYEGNLYWLQDYASSIHLFQCDS
jgi:hypothetical protein